MKKVPTTKQTKKASTKTQDSLRRLLMLKGTPLTQETALAVLEQDKKDAILEAVAEIMVSGASDVSQKISAARLLLEHRQIMEAQNIEVQIF